MVYSSYVKQQILFCRRSGTSYAEDDEMTAVELQRLLKSELYDASLSTILRGTLMRGEERTYIHRKIVSK